MYYMIWNFLDSIINIGFLRQVVVRYFVAVFEVTYIILYAIFLLFWQKKFLVKKENLCFNFSDRKKEEHNLFLTSHSI